MKYHVPTGFGFSPKASGFYPFGDATALPSHAAALTTGAKHWHRQKAVFYVFVFDSIHYSATMHTLSPEFSTEPHQLVGVGE